MTDILTYLEQAENHTLTHKLLWNNSTSQFVDEEPANEAQHSPSSDIVIEELKERIHDLELELEEKTKTNKSLQETLKAQKETDRETLKKW
jgi:predicted RNase H-like nuclease (RuvC/YqgF family)